jgi:hypothetical protein
MHEILVPLIGGLNENPAYDPIVGFGSTLIPSHVIKSKRYLLLRENKD